MQFKSYFCPYLFLKKDLVTVNNMLKISRLYSKLKHLAVCYIQYHYSCCFKNLSVLSNHRKNYQDSVPGVADFYNSWSGYNDELLWAAAWLYKSTKQQKYLDILKQRYDNYGGGGTPAEFSWDNKYAGVQVINIIN